MLEYPRFVMSPFTRIVYIYPLLPLNGGVIPDNDMKMRPFNNWINITTCYNSAPALEFWKVSNKIFNWVQLSGPIIWNLFAVDITSIVTSGPAIPDSLLFTKHKRCNYSITGSGGFHGHQKPELYKVNVLLKNPLVLLNDLSPKLYPNIFSRCLKE